MTLIKYWSVAWVYGSSRCVLNPVFPLEFRAKCLLCPVFCMGFLNAGSWWKSLCLIPGLLQVPASDWGQGFICPETSSLTPPLKDSGTFQ